MFTEIEKDRVQFLADVLVTAAEGGVNVWGDVIGYQYFDHDPAGSSFFVLECEDEDEEYSGLVDINIIDLGIRRIIANETNVNDQIRHTIMVGSALNDAGEIDAEGADVVVQAGLFSGLVFG